MVNKNKHRFTRCKDTQSIGVALQQWYTTPLGQQIAQGEQAQLDELLSDLFGYHLLLIGNADHVPWLRNSRVSHCMLMDVTGDTVDCGKSCLHARAEDLPVSSDTLDVIVLPHVVEFSEQPHQILREVERCLVPEGHVVLVGFNPFSLWSLWRGLLGWRGQLPWCGHFISITRIKDWLALLGFEMVETRHYFFRPPLQHESILERLYFMERFGRRLWPYLGGGYVVVARKRVTTLTPIKPRWRASRNLTSGLVEPMPFVKTHSQKSKQ